MTIFTLADARDEKRNAELPALAAAEAALADERRVAGVLAQHPEIGVLGYGTGRRYYAYIHSYDAEPYTSADVGDVALQLLLGW
jgi:hypothetical protein